MSEPLRMGWVNIARSGDAGPTFALQDTPDGKYVLFEDYARLCAQAEALAAVVEIARNGWHWCNAADHRADGMAHMQSRVKDLADKADAVLRAFREAPNDAG